MSQCKDCAGPIGKKNQSGRCRPCTARFVSSQPGWRERQAAGVRKKFEDPEYRAAHNARLKKVVANLTPEQIEARREHGRRRAPFLIGGNDPAARAKAGKSRSASVLAWCPPEWRDKYRELVRKGRRAAEAKAAVLVLIDGGPEPERYAQQWAQLSWCPKRYREHYDTLRKKTSAPEAKAMILDMIAAEARRPAPKAEPKKPLTFEEKLARVAAGSGLVSNIMPRRSAPAFTLGGVATGSL